MSRTRQAARNAGAGPATAEAVLAATCASSFEAKRGKTGDCGEKGNSSCAKQHSDYILKHKPQLPTQRFSSLVLQVTVTLLTIDLNV